MNRIAQRQHERLQSREKEARERSRRVIERASSNGIELYVIGSLTSGRFGLHSDVDFFVPGLTDPQRRVSIERIVASAFRGSSIPYDIVYASDLTPERAQEFQDVQL